MHIVSTYLPQHDRSFAMLDKTEAVSGLEARRGAAKDMFIGEPEP